MNQIITVGVDNSLYRIWTCGIMPLALALLGAVGGCHTPGTSSDTRVVFTTSPVFASIVEQVAREGYEVRSLLPAGQSPHSFEPRPSDARAMASGRFLISGAPNLDSWAVRMADVPGVSLMSLLPDSLRWPRDSEEPNPHFWLDPIAVKAIATPLAGALCAPEPDLCPALRQNARHLEASIDSLDTELRAALAPLNRAGFIVSHPFLDYFAARYELIAVNIVGGSGDLDPSAGHLSRLIQTAKDTGFVAVVNERSEPSPAARTVAEAAGLKLITVDPLGGGKDTISYQAVISRLASALLNAAQ